MYSVTSLSCVALKHALHNYFWKAMWFCKYDFLAYNIFSLLACFNLPSEPFLAFCCPRGLIHYLEWGLRSWESKHEPKCWIEYAQLWSEHHSFSMCWNPKSWMFVLVVNEHFSGSLIACYFSSLCEPNAHWNPISNFTNKSVWMKYEPQIYMSTSTTIMRTLKNTQQYRKVLYLDTQVWWV